MTVARGLSALLAGMALAVFAPVAAADVLVTDDRGVAQSFAQPPARIVSLLPSLTESVCALNACARLVGVDRYSDFPPEVQEVAKVGGGLDPQIEAIVALKPDVVLAASSSRAALRLESLGIPVLTFEPQNQADVLRVLQALGVLLYGADDTSAHVQWQSIQAQLAQLAQQVPAAMRGAKVYFEVGQGPYAAGQSSFIGETLAQLGLVNVVPAQLGAFPKLNPEFIVRADPDVILTSTGEPAALAQYPGWRNLRALKNQQVCAFSPEQTNAIVRPGPRMVQAAQAMLACLQQLAPSAPQSQ